MLYLWLRARRPSTGHEIPLVALSRSTGPVLLLLEAWNTKFSRFLDQASSSQPTQSFLATNTNIFNKYDNNRSISILSWKFPSSHDFEEYGNQIFCQENLINTSICGTMGSKTTNNCSQRRLMAQRQGCVRLAGSTSWGNDKYTKPSPISNRIPQNAIPAKAHSFVQWVTRLWLPQTQKWERKAVCHHLSFPVIQG